MYFHVSHISSHFKRMIFLVHISSCRWHILKLKRAYDLFWEIVEAWHLVSECMSCHKALVLITRRAHCFHDWIYITPILLLWDLNNGTMCVSWIRYDHDHLYYIYLYIYLYKIYFIYVYIIYIIHIHIYISVHE